MYIYNYIYIDVFQSKALYVLGSKHVYGAWSSIP